MKRVYVAGASAELDLVRGYMIALNMHAPKTASQHDWRITHDWTVPVEKHGSAALDLTPSERRKEASQALVGIRGADVFWLVLPSALTIGAWVELGAAVILRDDMDYIGMARPLIVVSGTTDSIFALLADKRFETHDAALEWLLGGMKP